MTYRIELPRGGGPGACERARHALLPDHSAVLPRAIASRVGKGDATNRLYYLTSNLNLAGTPMENWKIAIASATAGAGGGKAP